MITGLQVAQEFNKTVLKNQLNPNGATIASLGKTIDELMDRNRWFWKGFNQDEALKYWMDRAEKFEKQLKEIDKSNN